jgi:mannose-6-phosphate isomerase-like protein (cupin superfamily)
MSGGVIVAADEGPRHRGPMADMLRWIAGEAATGGAWSLHERSAPPGAESPGHTHSRLTEAFYLLEGTADFRIGDRASAAVPGTFALAAPGTRHGWRITGDKPARMLILFSPSAELRFFEELHELVAAAPDGQPQPRAFAALAQKYGWS